VKISRSLAIRSQHEAGLNVLFDSLMGCCIVANTITMLVELQWMGYKASVLLELYEDDGSWKHADFWFMIFDHSFNIVFCIELGFRMWLMRLRYFHELFNIFDFGIVMLTSIQLYVLEPMAFNSGGKMSLFRLLRFGRTVRVLRIVRVMRLFTELRVLVQTFISSMRALAWSMVFLFLLMVISAVFLSFSLQDFIVEPANNYTTRVWVNKYYGNSMNAIYTIFEVTLAGCWPQYLRPLVEQVSGFYVIFNLVYISVVVFAVTRIITALFLKETLQVASNDAEAQANDQGRKRKECIDRLRAVFNAVDTSGDGKLSLDEFNRICRNPDAQVYLRMLEIDISNAEGLFHMLDVKMVGEITFEDFLKGLMRLKGGARAVDMVAMMRTQDQLLTDLERVAQQTSELHANFVKGGMRSMRSMSISLAVAPQTPLPRHRSRESTQW
jgi:hypothetical protein